MHLQTYPARILTVQYFIGTTYKTNIKLAINNSSKMWQFAVPQCNSTITRLTNNKTIMWTDGTPIDLSKY